MPDGLELAVADVVLEGWTCVGPFGAQAIHLHRALVRLLWSWLYPESGLMGMPTGWWQGRHGRNVVLQQRDAGLLSELEAGLMTLATSDANWLRYLTTRQGSF